MPNLNIASGELQGPGSLTVSGVMNMTGGNLVAPGGPLDIPSGAVFNLATDGSEAIQDWTVNVDGALNWTQNGALNADSIVNINADGTLNISGTGAWADLLNDGGSQINNAGTLTVANTAPATIQTVFNSTGTISLQSAARPGR